MPYPKSIKSSIKTEAEFAGPLLSTPIKPRKINTRPRAAFVNMEIRYIILIIVFILPQHF
jgi:hypothetical protein